MRSLRGLGSVIESAAGWVAFSSNVSKILPRVTDLIGDHYKTSEADIFSLVKPLAGFCVAA